MLSTYQYPKYEYVTPPEQKSGAAGRYPVVVVGAGPVGLAAAIELAQSGVPVVLLDVPGRGRFVSSVVGRDAEVAALVQR